MKYTPGFGGGVSVVQLLGSIFLSNKRESFTEQKIPLPLPYIYFFSLLDAIMRSYDA